MTKKDIHIVLSSSEEFLPYCATTMTSILYNVAKDRFVHFYILSYDICENSKKVLKKVTKIAPSDIKYITFDESMLSIFEGIHTPPHVSKMTYARCFIPTLLPQVDKVIFLDCDTIVRGDISKLFDIDMGNYYFGAVEDIGKQVVSQRLFNKDDGYYTCGVMLVNCQLMRKEKYLEKLKSIRPERTKLYLLCDQDVLNDIFHEKFFPISFRWDFYHEWHFFKVHFTPTDQKDYDESLKNPTIIHYVGPDKPWYPVVKHPYKKDYMYYYKKQPFYNKFQFFYLDDYKTRNTHYHVLRLKGLTLWSFVKSEDKKAEYTKISMKIFGLQLYRYKQVVDKSVISILGIPIIKRKNKSGYQKIYLLGILIKKKKNDNTLSEVKSLVLQTKAQMDNLNKKINTELRFIYMSISHMQAIFIHKDTFDKYRNCFDGKTMVLVACGPTVTSYDPLPGAIHVGVNRAFKQKKIKLDFLFAQDRFPEGMDEINAYPCTKFYGYLSNERNREMRGLVCRISQADYGISGACKYIIEDIVCGHWASDLAIEPIGDFQGCCFSALQFIYFCHPQKIYLVGCDCSSAKNHTLQVADVNLTGQIKSWRLFKNFMMQNYPEIEIISVNPVGLKGLFKDVYTEEYLYVHPEIRHNVELLDTMKGKICLIKRK